jgi:hypothetical protein
MASLTTNQMVTAGFRNEIRLVSTGRGLGASSFKSLFCQSAFVGPYRLNLLNSLSGIALMTSISRRHTGFT